MPMLLIVYTVIQGTGAIAGEEGSGTIDVLMSQPITRTEMVLQKTGSVCVGAALIAAISVPRLPAVRPLRRHQPLAEGRGLGLRQHAADGALSTTPSRCGSGRCCRIARTRPPRPSALATARLLHQHYRRRRPQPVRPEVRLALLLLRRRRAAGPRAQTGRTYRCSLASARCSSPARSASFAARDITIGGASNLRLKDVVGRVFG